VARSALTSTYHDTDDLRLAAGGIRLRRREGAGVSEWRLTLPRDGDRLALRWDAPDERIPHEIRRLLTAHTRGRPLTTAASPPRRPHRLAADERGAAAGRSHAALQRMLRVQYAEILRHDPATRLGEDADALHDHRVAVRRLRAMLRAGRPLLDRPWADDLRAALRRAGRALAEVRDLDVMIADIEAMARALPDAERASAANVVAVLRERRAQAQARLASDLCEPWYVSLLNRLEQAVEAPRFAGGGSLAKVVRKEHRRVRRLVKKLPTTPEDGDLHAVRKAVKRARYAAELADAAGVAGMARYVKRAKRLQDVLGAHQDAVVAAEVLADMDGASAAPAIREAYGERRSEARTAFPKAWGRLENSLP
jgi:CHAD domain-containing protein